MIEFVLSSEQANEWLNFNQFTHSAHPTKHIITWMSEQGYAYHKDWDCICSSYSNTLIDNWGSVKTPNYVLTFNDDKAATAFILKWAT